MADAPQRRLAQSGLSEDRTVKEESLVSKLRQLFPVSPTAFSYCPITPSLNCDANKTSETSVTQSSPTMSVPLAVRIGTAIDLLQMELYRLSLKSKDKTCLGAPSPWCVNTNKRARNHINLCSYLLMCTNKQMHINTRSFPCLKCTRSHI